MRTSNFKLVFVENVPFDKEEGTLYISMKYKVVVHNCACGCGSKVVLTLSPATWQLQYDGQTVTIEGSVGNWTLPCQSHYWIIENKVVWADRWSKSRIEAGYKRDKIAVSKFYGTKQTSNKKKAYWQEYSVQLKS